MELATLRFGKGASIKPWFLIRRTSGPPDTSCDLSASSAEAGSRSFGPSATYDWDTAITLDSLERDFDLVFTSHEAVSAWRTVMGWGRDVGVSAP